MRLLELDGTRVIPSPECLQIKPFKKIWERDKSKNKEVAKAELAFVYFFRSFQSEFSSILEDDDRQTEVLKILDYDKEPDEVVYEACDIYLEAQSTVSSELLMSARKGVEKVKQFFNTVNLNERDKNGRPVFDADKFNRTLSNLANTVKSLTELESLVLREQEIKSEMKGGREKAMFEDGI